MKLLERILIFAGLSLYLSFVSINKNYEVQGLQRKKAVAQSISNDNQGINGVDVQYVVTDVYKGAYRIELRINGNSNSDFEWQGSINLPENHRILENYGVLISQGEERVNFSGDSWNKNLSQEDNTFAVLIIEGNPDEAGNIFFDRPINSLDSPKFSSIYEEERRQFDPGFDVEKSPTFRRVNIGEAETTTIEENVAETRDESGEVELPTEEEVISEDISISEDREVETTTIEENVAVIRDESGEVELPTEEEGISRDISISDYQNLDNSSGSGNFNYADALDLNWLFFMANRSGSIGEDNVLAWRSDSTLQDGNDVGRDLTGGYFDAGDHIKFILPMAYSMTMLAWSGVDYMDSYEKAGQFQSLLNAVRQGTDYFLKSHEMSGGKTQRLWVQVGDREDHYFWVPPEKIDEITARPSFAIDASMPGTDAAAGTAAALASASMLFAVVDPGYSAELLKNAIALFDFAETHKGKYSDSVSAANPFYTSWSGYEDELVMGAIWIYRASGESSYLTKAENYFKQGIGHIGQYTYVADDASYGALPLIAKESDDSFFKDEFQDWANYWLNAQGGVNHTSDGLAVRSEWASVPLALSSSYLLEWYNDFVETNQAYSLFAQQQVDYVLGDNSLGLSYLIGFGDNFPVRPHHRGSAGSQPLDSGDAPNDNVLYGAIVGGPRNDDFSHNDRRNDWVTNEVGTSYNAPFAASAIQQVDNNN